MAKSLQSRGPYPARLLCPWDSPGKNTGVGCHALLQGIFPTQGLNPGLLHYRQILYHLSHQENPSILEWVAYSFTKGSSRPWSRTQVSCIAGRFFYHLSHQGSPRILEWVAYPFSRGSSQPRNQTGVTCMSYGFFMRVQSRWRSYEHSF